MFALDLFNNDHERRLAEGAVDKLEQRRIDDLAMKMDDLVARARQANTPAAKAALIKEFQKCKAERDSYFKIKEPQDECMGYGTLGEETEEWYDASGRPSEQGCYDAGGNYHPDRESDMDAGYDAYKERQYTDEAGLPDVANKQAKMARINQPGRAGTDVVTPQQRMGAVNSTMPKTGIVAKAADTAKSFANWLAGKDDVGPTYEDQMNEVVADSRINAAKYVFSQLQTALNNNVDIATIRWMNNPDPITLTRNQIYHVMQRLQTMSRQNRNNFAQQTLADRNNFALWLGGQKKVQQRPALKQPTDPFQPELPLNKPQVSPVSERAQKKNSKNPKFGDAETANVVRKIRAKHPAARSDVEALAKDELDHQKRSDQQLAAIQGANTKQDELLRQLVALDQEQGREIDSLDTENDGLEAQLARIQATNSRLQQTVQAMNGTKKSARAKKEPTTIKTEPKTTASVATVAPSAAEGDPEVAKKLQGLEAQITQLQKQTPSTAVDDQIANLQSRINSLAPAIAQATGDNSFEPKNVAKSKKSPKVSIPPGDFDIEPPKAKAEPKLKAKPKTKPKTKPKAKAKAVATPTDSETSDDNDNFDILGFDKPATELDPEELKSFNETTADQFGKAAQQTAKTGQQLQRTPEIRRLKQTRDYEMMLKKELANRIQDRDAADDEQDFQDVDEGRMNKLSLEYEDWKRMAPVSFLNRYKISKEDWYNKYRSVVEPKPARRRMSAQLARSPVGKKMNAMYGSTCPGCGNSTNPDRCVCEGYQDFKKPEPYYVCLAGKPVKQFDYYEQARQFHDNWKKKLYREGNKEKADKITLMPVMDESEMTPDEIRGRVEKNIPHAIKGMIHDYTTMDDNSFKQAHGLTRQQFYQQLSPQARDYYMKEATNPAQQAAIAINMKKHHVKPKHVDEDAIPGKMVTQGFVVEYDPTTRTVTISKRGQELDRFSFKGQPNLVSFQRTIAKRVKDLEDDLYGADGEAGAVNLSRMKIPGRGYGYQELGEDNASAPAEQAILRRIMVAHTDLLKQFGPQKVMQAAEEVAYNVGDIDEIGSSDVSAWVNEVKQILGAE